MERLEDNHAEIKRIMTIFLPIYILSGLLIGVICSFLSYNIINYSLKIDNMRAVVRFVGIFLPVFVGFIASGYLFRLERFNDIPKYWKNIYVFIWLIPWAITIIKITFFRKG